MTLDTSTIAYIKTIIGFISLAGIAAALKIVKSLYEFHGIIRKQSIAHSDYLITQAEGNVQLLGFLKRLKAEQIFLSAFRVRTSSRNMKLLMELYETDCFSLSELRACFFYAYRTQDGSVDVKPGALGWFSLISGTVLLAITALMAASLIVGALKLKSTTEILVVVSAALIMFLFMLWFVGRDIRDVITAYCCRRRLAKQREARE